MGAGLGRARRRRAGGGGPVHGVLRRLPLLHRRADRPARRVPRRHSASSTTRSSCVVSDNGASAEGGAEGSINDIRLRTSTRPAPPRCTTGSTRSAARSPTTTTRGAGRWPATRPSGAGSARCTRAGWPIRASSRWPARRSAVVPAASATSSPTPSTSCRPCWSWPGSSAPDEIEHVPQTRHRRHRASPTCWARTAPTAPERHETQHFEMFGSRAIYHRGWKAVTFHPVGPALRRRLNPNAPFDDDVWELYHVAEDLSEIRDLAAEHPDMLAELVERWWEEARRNQVLPLDNRVLWTLVHPKPDHRRARATAFGTSRAAPRCPRRWRSTCGTVPTPSSVDVTVPTGSVPTGCSWHSGPRSAAGRCISSTAGSATCTTSTARSATSIEADELVASRRAHTLGLLLRQGRRPRWHRNARCDGREVWPRAPIARFTPVWLQRGRGGPDLRLRVGTRRRRRATEHRSRSTGTIHRRGGRGDRTGRPRPARRAGRDPVGAVGKQTVVWIAG